MRIVTWIRLGIGVAGIAFLIAALGIHLSGIDIPHDAVGGLYHFTAGMRELFLIAIGGGLLVIDGIWLVVSLVFKKVSERNEG